MTKPILIIDDDPDIRDALRDAIEDEGYSVALACNGREGLEYLEANPHPALIFLDWMMPVLDGAQFCDAVSQQQQLHTIPIVLLTADTRARQKASGAQIAGFLKKPVGIDELLSWVQRYAGDN